ncbi:MAG: 50S ribosomal protein L23 [Candidatus Babeliales bacterium]
MALKIYDIIQGPAVTEKASKLVSNQKKVVLKIHPKANKPMVKEALEKLFNVKVENIRTIVRKGKVRTFKRMKSTGKLTKRAIVTLKPGYSLDVAESAPEQQAS